MQVIQVRVTNEELEEFRVRAASVGLGVEDVVRQAVDKYLRDEPKVKGIRKFFAKGDDCVHPWSKRIQNANGVQCDECGRWI